MRDFTGKNCTTLDTLAYHHWLLTFSSLSIIEITTWACGKSTCAALLQVRFLRAFFFTDVIQGGPLVEATDHPWFRCVSRLMLLEKKTCINERQMTGWNKQRTRNFHFEDTSFACLWLSYDYGY